MSATTRTQMNTICEEDVLQAQEAWCAGLIAISEMHKAQGPEKAKETASKFIDAAYGFDHGDVLFKPTLALAPQTFRTTKEGTLSYFVGQNPNFPTDKGFGLKGWVSYEIENAGVQVLGHAANSMGKIRLTDGQGHVTEVDKTFGFIKDDEGRTRIVLHHSSLPVSGK